MDERDVFDDVIQLEEQYYDEGYNLGVADGSKSGRVEGRTFGLEKGFEKGLEMGQLHGRALVWEARLARSSSSDSKKPTSPAEAQLLPMKGSDRLRKHIDRLAALTDPNDLSCANDEDAVSEFDDRLKDAKAKLTLIVRTINEDDNVNKTSEAEPQNTSSARNLRVRRAGPSSSQGKTREMEDFNGLPGSAI